MQLKTHKYILCGYVYTSVCAFLFIKISVCIKPWAANSVLQGLTGDTDEFCAQGPQRVKYLGNS